MKKRISKNKKEFLKDSKSDKKVYALFPSFIKKLLTSESNIGKATANMKWMLINNFVRMFLVLIMSIYVARYLGPSDFGLLNYILSFVALFAVFSTLGLDDIIIKKLLEKKDDENKILGTGFFLKLIGAFFLVIFSYLTILFMRNDPVISVLVIIASIYYFFRTFDVIYFYFLSKTNSKWSTYATIFSLLIVSILKILLIIFKFPLIYFIWTFTFEAIFGAIFLIMYYKSKSNKSIFKWKFDLSVLKDLLKQSWPLIISSAVILIYMKIDQVMIGQMIGIDAVGNYAVAAKISEFWYAIPAALSISIFPFIINSKKLNKNKYYKNLQHLQDVLTIMSISIAIIFTFISGYVINLLYGPDYALAGQILAVHIWAGVFAFSSISSSKYLIIENLTKVSLYRNLAGAIINILLNLWLIPIYGVIGAAYATLIAYGFVATFGNLFNKKSRIIFVMFLRSLNFVRSIKELYVLIRRHDDD